MPLDTIQLYQPFSFITGLITRTNPDGTIAGINYDVLEQYITQGTRYWGDDTAIDAVNYVLKINAIVIKKGNQGLANSISSQLTGVFTNNEMKNGLDMSKWSTFLFLYFIEDLTKKDEAAHYELLTFLFPVQTTVTDLKGNVQTTYPERTFTIFKKNDIEHPPPLYMLLLIFGFKYMSPGQNPAEFDFFTGFNQVIDTSYKSIISIPGNVESKCKLLNDLYDLFLWPYLLEQINDAKCVRNIRGKKKVVLASSVSGKSKLGEVVESDDEADLSGKEEGEIDEIDGGAGNTRKYNSNYNSNYNNRYPNYNRYPNNYRNNFLRSDLTRDLSKIGYYISIDMELKKGSPLTPEEIKQSKCTQKWNAVRKAFANFTGKTYTIPPVYDYSNKQTLKNRSNTQPSNVTKSNRPNAPPPQTNAAKTVGGTRKIQNVQKIYSGKHSKTRKLIE
jgi:hypothetical protein